MTCLPKKRGITQDGEDKSLILRQNLGNSPEVTSDENSYAEIDDSRTIPDVPISHGLYIFLVERGGNQNHKFKQLEQPIDCLYMGLIANTKVGGRLFLNS